MKAETIGILCHSNAFKIKKRNKALCDFCLGSSRYCIARHGMLVRAYYENM